MNGALLDTHVLIWWRFDEPKLSSVARRTIETTEDIYVSAASVYEIDSKRRRAVRTGRADPLAAMPDNLLDAIPRLGFVLLDITAEAAWRAANLEIDHGDPWDRILIAQARIMDLALISADRVLLTQAGDTPVIW